jgi:hypothetical protein
MVPENRNENQCEWQPPSQIIDWDQIQYLRGNTALKNGPYPADGPKELGHQPDQNDSPMLDRVCRGNPVADTKQKNDETGSLPQKKLCRYFVEPIGKR